MPHSQVIFYRELSGEAPVLTWLKALRRGNVKAWANFLARIELLKTFGHELRRPAADYLRDGVYELRAKQGHVQYRILYFFHGRNIVVLAHGLTKEKTIPAVEIERAIKRKQSFESNPKAHTYEEEIEND